MSKLKSYGKINNIGLGKDKRGILWIHICEMEEPSYQMEMLRKNRPVGLLPVQICAINKQKEYHYDAGSFMALSEYLEKRVINCEMLGYFMESIKGVLSSIEEYLLEADCLCMLPEHIYLDEKEYMLQFCYGPY